MHIFIIGPGGVGKSTAGEILAQKLNYCFMDLDHQFAIRLGNISEFIEKKGLIAYRQSNSELFEALLANQHENTVFALSSGFLAHKERTEKNAAILKEHGISILLLPSRSLGKSRQIVVSRQLKRGFGLIKEREKEKFTERFYLYKAFGDIQIFSNDAPAQVASLIEKKILQYRPFTL